MEIHKPKWHSGNIKTWHILCSFHAPHTPHGLLPLYHSIPPSLLQGFSTEKHICCVEILLKDMSTLTDTDDWADRWTDTPTSRHGKRTDISPLVASQPKAITDWIWLFDSWDIHWFNRYSAFNFGIQEIDATVPQLLKRRQQSEYVSCVGTLEAER